MSSSVNATHTLAEAFWVQYDSGRGGGSLSQPAGDGRRRRRMGDRGARRTDGTVFPPFAFASPVHALYCNPIHAVQYSLDGGGAPCRQGASNCVPRREHRGRASASICCWRRKGVPRRVIVRGWWWGSRVRWVLFFVREGGASLLLLFGCGCGGGTTRRIQSQS
ncbi:hypothetical protein BDW22DRAFT_455103 [Trametopsis cervina]|nr:hypothetical protein BDW22DRAFT_455103 [Trametopsis cervina]